MFYARTFALLTAALLAYLLYQVLSPLALSFYEGCIRARNDKLKSVLGVTLRYPNYREGLRALHATGDRLAV